MLCTVERCTLGWAGGFDCLLTLISIKKEHPQPLQVCTILCIVYDTNRWQGDLGIFRGSVGKDFDSEMRLGFL